MTDMRKCGIVGCGNVGAATAYALLQSGLFSELVLVDIDRARAAGEAEDLCHGMPFLSPTEVRAGDHEDLTDAGIVIVTAGTAQKQGQTRLDLARANARLFADLIPSITRYNTEGILLVVTNPVDILTEVTRRLSGFPASRVIGSGTVLDTARLKFLLGRHLGVDSRNVHAFIIGEHGDTEFPVYSSANISGVDLTHFCGKGCPACGQYDLQKFFVDVRDAAYRIIKAKGSTCYGIAEAVRRIVTAIVREEDAILPVSVPVAGHYGYEGLCLSLPAVVGHGGVSRVLEIPLSDEEHALLARSATRLREVLRDLMPVGSLT